jgi:toxin ParE1/3/4
VKRQLRLHPRAEADLAEIWLYTAKEWSRAQANRYVMGLDKAFTLLTDQPEVARCFSSMLPPVHVYRYQAHIVMFTADDDLVQVIRVVHARSNWQALLAE